MKLYRPYSLTFLIRVQEKKKNNSKYHERQADDICVLAESVAFFPCGFNERTANQRNYMLQFVYINCYH